jgi:transcriptional regulator with XRE-family HTH domain
MSPARRLAPPSRSTIAAEARIRATIAAAIRDERRSRHLLLRHVAEAAGVAISVVHDAENARAASLESLIRIAGVLDIRLELDAIAPRRVETARHTDLVHAAMGELEAVRLRGHGFTVGIDEPYQHYQFAGRGDVVAWSLERWALLHIENRTRFPNVQDTAGAFNAKRAYLGKALADRLGIAGWRSETHVLAALWSAETLHVMRLRGATFASVCPDPLDAFDRWWSGDPPIRGNQSILLALDPARELGRQRRYAGRDAIGRIEPRYRDYADAARRLTNAA